MSTVTIQEAQARLSDLIHRHCDAAVVTSGDELLFREFIFEKVEDAGRGGNRIAAQLRFQIRPQFMLVEVSVPFRMNCRIMPELRRLVPAYIFTSPNSQVADLDLAHKAQPSPVARPSHSGGRATETDALHSAGVLDFSAGLRGMDVYHEDPRPMDGYGYAGGEEFALPANPRFEFLSSALSNLSGHSAESNCT